MTAAQPYDCFDMISSPVFVLEVNAADEPVYVAMNAYARKVSGRPLSDYVGHTALEVYPMAYGRTAYARHREVMQSGKPMTYELDLPLGDKVSTVQTTLRPELDQQGRVIRLFGSSVDTTAERDAREAKVAFDTMSSEMEQFVAFAAHDLRAPMRNIATLADLLRAEFADADDDKLEMVKLISSVATQSMNLITDVLSHTQTVSSETNDTVFSFPALCHAIWTTLDPTDTHHFTAALLALRADRTAMQIVLRNLTENAIKHGGRDRLEISVEVAVGLPGMIEVTLTDNGKGFSDAALKVMNGGRFRVESGYGLFGIKRLISARGGTLVACNLPNGSGAVVRFSLPGTILGDTASLGDRPEAAHPTHESFKPEQRHTA